MVNVSKKIILGLMLVTIGLRSGACKYSISSAGTDRGHIVGSAHIDSAKTWYIDSARLSIGDNPHTYGTSCPSEVNTPGPGKVSCLYIDVTGMNRKPGLVYYTEIKWCLPQEGEGSVADIVNSQLIPQLTGRPLKQWTGVAGDVVPEIGLIGAVCGMYNKIQIHGTDLGIEPEQPKCAMSPNNINIQLNTSQGAEATERQVPDVVLECTGDADIQLKTNSGEEIPLGGDAKAVAVLDWGAGYGAVGKYHVEGGRKVQIPLRVKTRGLSSKEAGVYSGSAVVNVSYH